MKSENITELLKKELWKQYGNPAIRSEWDGKVYGGGKLSQRFWEYFQTIEMLNLSKDSVLLDIGGGSPDHGTGFFAGVVAPHIAKVIIVDSTANDSKNQFDNVEIVPMNADYKVLQTVFEQHSITHVSCISVFEHIEDTMRIEMMKALNSFSNAEKIAITLEFHSNIVHFEHQLTTHSLSNLVLPLQKYYLTGYHKSPIHCENAVPSYSPQENRYKKIFQKLFGSNKITTELWYPIALEFVKV